MRSARGRVVEAAVAAGPRAGPRADAPAAAGFLNVSSRMSSTPQYSVVVTTYNRAATLRGAVESLLALSPESPPYELIVVDNNSTDDTRRVVEALVPQSGGRLRYVFEPRQGASHGRNAGAAAARGAVLAFTDDDVRAGPGWLAAVARAFEAHPDVDYVGGRVRPIWPAPPPRWLTAHAHTSPLALIDYGDAPVLVTPECFRCFVTANLAVRKAAFDAVGGFDPRFQHEPGAVTAIEDHELQIRLLNAGRRGLYAPDVEIRAEVQANRLDVTYHRRWWFDSGRARARLTPPGHVFDGDCTITPEPAHARRLLGAPLFVYREVLTGAGRALAARVRGDLAESYRWEFVARRALGYISHASASRRRGAAGRAAPARRPAGGVA